MHASRDAKTGRFYGGRTTGSKPVSDRAIARAREMEDHPGGPNLSDDDEETTDDQAEALSRPRKKGGRH